MIIFSIIAGFILAILFIALVQINGDEDDNFIPFSKDDQDFEK